MPVRGFRRSCEMWEKKSSLSASTSFSRCGHAIERAAEIPDLVVPVLGQGLGERAVREIARRRGTAAAGSRVIR